MRLSDIEKPTTVLALLAGAAAGVVGVLVTLGVLLENWTEPGCDVGNPDRVAASCDINAVDYTHALPYAVVTVVVVLLTGVLCWRVLRHERQARGSSRSARIQVGIVVTLPMLIIVGFLAAVVSPMVQL